MKFAQIIEFTTGRIDEFNARLDEWMARSDGHRIPHQAVLRRDRDAQDRYLLMVEFACWEQDMENSRWPETGEFAAFLAGISDGGLTFRNLDVLREEKTPAGKVHSPWPGPMLPRSAVRKAAAGQRPALRALDNRARRPVSASSSAPTRASAALGEPSARLAAVRSRKPGQLGLAQQRGRVRHRHVPDHGEACR